MIDTLDPYPLGYFITWTTYGTRLHGDGRGSVDRRHNVFCEPFLAPSPEFEAFHQRRLLQRPYRLGRMQRKIVLQSLVETCEFCDWILLAAHVRLLHIHSVVQATCHPKKILNKFKMMASRRLNESGLEPHGRKRWTRRGSTRYLWVPEGISRAIAYTLEEQGQPFETYERPGWNAMFF
ncbi:MAG TPA: hypothetical protein VMY18_10605 [Acidobacteriota bacterium]|nr:hypothetical protein [Acidobacteriota bacterium]